MTLLMACEDQASSPTESPITARDQGLMVSDQEADLMREDTDPPHMTADRDLVQPILDAEVQPPTTTDEGVNDSGVDIERTDAFMTSSNELRYLKITTLESPSWVSWFEVQVFAEGFEGANLALNASVTASSTEAISSTNHLNDGDEMSSWNSGDFAPAFVELDLRETIRLEELRLKVAQSPSGYTRHQVEASSDGQNYQVITIFEGNTSGGDWLIYQPDTSTVIPPNRECSSLEFNLIMQQIVQPTSDSSIWFWGMSVPEQRERLEVTYEDQNGQQVAVFQAGPLGTHGDLWAARILGENPYWGPGSCPADRPDCPDDFLHHFQARGTVDGAPLWHGILRGDLSVIPCNAQIISARLHLHINEDEGLANADHVSVVHIHRGLRRWNPRWVNGRRYDRNTMTNTDLTWTSLGGDFGEFIMDLQAQRDFWDRGFHKANPRFWVDVTDHLIELQSER